MTPFADSLTSGEEEEEEDGGVSMKRDGWREVAGTMWRVGGGGVVEERTSY